MTFFDDFVREAPSATAFRRSTLRRLVTNLVNVDDEECDFFVDMINSHLAASTEDTIELPKPFLTHLIEHIKELK